eukprot:1285503-Amphidinium_carterae.1
MPRDGAEDLTSCGAAPVEWWAAKCALLENAAAASTWHVMRTWRSRCASTGLCPCVRATPTSTLSQEQTSPGCDTFGTKLR